MVVLPSRFTIVGLLTGVRVTGWCKLLLTATDLVGLARDKAPLSWLGVFTVMKFIADLTGFSSFNSLKMLTNLRAGGDDCGASVSSNKLSLADTTIEYSFYLKSSPICSSKFLLLRNGKQLSLSISSHDERELRQKVVDFLL